LEDKFSLNQQKIQDITNSINDFKAKLSQILEIKIERDKRMQELEEKIASTVDKNFQEVMKIEQQIADLEEKYTKLADLEEHDSESLRKIRIKIRQLKQLLEIKKEEYAKKSKIPLPELRPKLIASIKPFPRKPEIRHEMRIFPTPPEIPKELKPMPPKKFGIPKKPEPIWREKISLRKEEGIRLKPEEEIPYKPKPELPSLPSFKEVLPGLPKLKPEEFKPFPPKIKPFPEFKTFEEQVMPSPPTHVLRRELPPIPEPPRPPRIEGELLPPSMAFPRKLTFWDKIKNIFRKKT
jgi:flagellar biosynthesis chaperone FliJ